MPMNLNLIYLEINKSVLHTIALYRVFSFEYVEHLCDFYYFEILPRSFFHYLFLLYSLYTFVKLIYMGQDVFKNFKILFLFVK